MQHYASLSQVNYANKNNFKYIIDQIYIQSLK